MKRFTLKNDRDELFLFEVEPEYLDECFDNINMQGNIKIIDEVASFKDPITIQITGDDDETVVAKLTHEKELLL